MQALVHSLRRHRLKVKDELTAPGPPVARSTSLVQKHLTPMLDPAFLAVTFDLLDPRDLYVCSRVCKAWCTISTPVLWRTIDIRYEQLDRFTQEEAQYALARNSHHVQILVVRISAILRFFIRLSRDQSVLCPNLSTLHLTTPLELGTDLDPKSSDLMVYLTRQSPKLEDIQVCVGQDPFFMRRLTNARPDLCAGLFRDWSVEAVIDDEAISTAITTSPRLSWISLNKCRTAGALTVKAICSKCLFLQDLDVRGCQGLPNDGLRSIMSSIPTLKTLQAISDGDNNPACDPQIVAEDNATTCSWASTSLERLECRITVPRSNKHSNPKPQYCRRVQGYVLDTLARQVGLKELRLGYNNVHPLYQKHCLDLSVDAGLDRLGTLQQLCVLDVSYMNHHIGPTELSWMNDNWPNLKSVIGISLDSSPAVEAWVWANQPSWQLLA